MNHDRRSRTRRVYLTSKRAHEETMKLLTLMHEHQHAILERMNHMSAELDRLTTEVEETKTAVDSALTLIAGLADQIRNLPANAAALTKFADDLDAKQAEIAAAITANTPAP